MSRWVPGVFVDADMLAPRFGPTSEGTSRDEPPDGERWTFRIDYPASADLLTDEEMRRWAEDGIRPWEEDQ